MKRMTALLGALLLVLVFGASQAVAADGGGAAQGAGQFAGSGQTAGAGSGALQAGASNSGSSIRVLSPGNDGAVSQSNSTTAGALAANGNTTSQSTTQSQLGGYGSGQTQIAGQAAQNKQDANADATAVQLAPSNDAQSIRVLSPGNGGNLTQSNSATAGAAALNGNETDQSTDQSQGGSGYGSDQTQIAGQAASNDQSADADATAVQVKPSNSASSIRVLSPGDDGDVSQSNAATAVGIAANGNSTDQSTDQSQGGGGYGSDQQQVAGQEASNEQTADADATAVQIKPSNTASSIRVLSPGNGGNVSQSNSTTAVAAGLNGNKTDQSVDQSQGGGMAPTTLREDDGYGKSKPDKGSDGTQIAGQSATNNQSADADATAVQVKPSNSASSIRVLSPGNDGDVSQSNAATAVGIAANGNWTDQSIDQSQGSGSMAPVRGEYPGAKSGYGSDATQVAGQEASNEQTADADATAVQIKPSNTASSIRVLSPGNGGNVSQSNSTTAVAAGLNGNKTDQSVDQSQGGGMAPTTLREDDGYGKSKPDKGSDGTQIAGQSATNNQSADADATAVQVKPSNSASSIRVLSPGNDGDVSQSNAATAVGIAANGNWTDQSIDQSQGSGSMAPVRGEYPGAKSGYGSDATQVAGQEASNNQTRRRGRDGGPAEAVEHEPVDPGAEPGQRR